MPPELKASIPVLVPLFDRLANLTHRGNSSKTYPIMLWGKSVLPNPIVVKGCFESSMLGTEKSLPRNTIIALLKSLPETSDQCERTRNKALI